MPNKYTLEFHARRGPASLIGPTGGSRGHVAKLNGCRMLSKRCVFWCARGRMGLVLPNATRQTDTNGGNVHRRTTARIPSAIQTTEALKSLRVLQAQERCANLINIPSRPPLMLRTISTYIVGCKFQTSLCCDSSVEYPISSVDMQAMRRTSRKVAAAPCAPHIIWNASTTRRPRYACLGLH